MHLTQSARIPTAATEQPIATTTRVAMDLAIRQVVSGAKRRSISYTIFNKRIKQQHEQQLLKSSR
jgi:hypothetical protein